MTYPVLIWGGRGGGCARSRHHWYPDKLFCSPAKEKPAIRQKHHSKPLHATTHHPYTAGLSQAAPEC